MNEISEFELTEEVRAVKKTIKILRNIILILLAVLLIFILVTYIVHCAKTKEEFDALRKNDLYNPVSV